MWHARLLVGPAALAVVACAGDEGGSPACPEGEIRVEGVCTPYAAGEPVPFGDAWRPAPGTSWQWQLTGDIDGSIDVDMYDVDLFNATDAELDELRAAGRIVVCYFSAGSWEAWRADADAFPDEALGATLDGWEDERWLDLTDATVREIMLARLDLALARGCDGVEPDNVDGYANDNGVGLNATEQLEYDRFIADAAHERGLSVGLKNDLDQIEALLPWFDWALDEECAAYDECERLTPFLEAGRAVFHVEYVDDWSDAPALAEQVCAAVPELDTLIKTWDLGAEYLACPRAVAALQSGARAARPERRLGTSRRARRYTKKTGANPPPGVRKLVVCPW